MANLSRLCHRLDHPNPNVEAVEEIRPDEYVFTTHPCVEFEESRVRALSEHFGAGFLS